MTCSFVKNVYLVNTEHKFLLDNHHIVSHYIYPCIDAGVVYTSFVFNFDYSNIFVASRTARKSKDDSANFYHVF